MYKLYYTIQLLLGTMQDAGSGPRTTIQQSDMDQLGEIKPNANANELVESDK